MNRSMNNISTQRTFSSELQGKFLTCKGLPARKGFVLLFMVSLSRVYWLRSHCGTLKFRLTLTIWPFSLEGFRSMISHRLYRRYSMWLRAGAKRNILRSIPEHHHSFSKRKLEFFKPPFLSGETIPFGSRVKYLKVILDKTLTLKTYLKV